jgi:hypothetical protein
MALHPNKPDFCKTRGVTCGWTNTLICLLQLLKPFKFGWDETQKYFYELLVPEGKWTCDRQKEGKLWE